MAAIILLISIFVFIGIFLGLPFMSFILSLLLLILIIARGIVLLKALHNNKKLSKKLDITNVDKGGVIKLTGVGENYDELTLKVLAKHLYREGDYYWYELECDKGEDEKIWIDVEVDDDVKVSIVLKKLTMSDIYLSNTLKYIDDEEEGFAKYNNKTFYYEESDEAEFYRFCDDSKVEKFYYWDFISDEFMISVERWGKKSYEIFYSQILRKSQITVLLNKEEGK